MDRRKARIYSGERGSRKNGPRYKMNETQLNIKIQCKLFFIASLQSAGLDLSLYIYTIYN